MPRDFPAARRTAPVRWLLSLYYQLGHLVRELMKFSVVGAAACVVDFGLFNVFRVVLDFGPLTSRCCRAWSRSRWRTSATGIGRSDTELGRASGAVLLFFILNAIGLGISLTVLAISHYVLGFTSPADNIAANVVGLVLATTFRFVGYRTWVFRAVTDPAVPPGPTEWVAPSTTSGRSTRSTANDQAGRDGSSAGSQPSRSDDLAPRDPEPAAG